MEIEYMKMIYRDTVVVDSLIVDLRINKIFTKTKYDVVSLFFFFLNNCITKM